jgi:phosphate transport system permease protein
VIYALCTVIVVQGFMAPKFAGADLGDPTLRTHAAMLGEQARGFGGLPDRPFPNSSFLGGVMLALLIVPFMAPLIDDALRSVPADLKNGSYALGASRWYTLRRIILPSAMPGILSAATLGGLLAIGEVIIPYFVLGTGAAARVTIPDPFWDIFRATPTLTSWATGKMGGFGGDPDSDQALAASVSFAAGLLLLGLAFGIMTLEQFALRRLNRTRP